MQLSKHLSEIDDISADTVDFPDNHMKFKSWYLKYSVAEEVIADAEQFMEEAAKLFRIMKPFNDYLNKALEGFQMPER